MRNFLRNRWFELGIFIIVILFIAEFFLILKAPHDDEENRGFSVCSKQMFTDVSNCNSQIWCTFKAVSKNYICYNLIIFKGFKNWITKKSPTPWSDYLFEPEPEEIQPELAEFYEQNPNIAEQMQTLIEKKLELENKNNDNK